MLGLTFKPNTDDMREAPSLVIVPALIAQGAQVRAYDPHGMNEARKLMPSLDTAADPYACMDGADVMVILTEWDQFRALDLDRIKASLRIRWWSTCATSTGRPTWRSGAFVMSASGAAEAGEARRRCKTKRRAERRGLAGYSRP